MITTILIKTSKDFFVFFLYGFFFHIFIFFSNFKNILPPPPAHRRKLARANYEYGCSADAFLPLEEGREYEASAQSGENAHGHLVVIHSCSQSQKEAAHKNQISGGFLFLFESSDFSSCHDWFMRGPVFKFSACA